MSVSFEKRFQTQDIPRFSQGFPRNKRHAESLAPGVEVPAWQHHRFIAIHSKALGDCGELRYQPGECRGRIITVREALLIYIDIPCLTVAVLIDLVGV